MLGSLGRLPPGARAAAPETAATNPTSRRRISPLEGALSSRSLGSRAVGRDKIGPLLEPVVDGVTAQNARQLISISDGAMLGAKSHDELYLDGAESGKFQQLLCIRQIDSHAGRHTFLRGSP